jgi:hypothetical protein
MSISIGVGGSYTNWKKSGEKALKYLLLTNSGGAIATLSFLGAATKVPTEIRAIPVRSRPNSCWCIDRQNLSSHVKSFQKLQKEC